MKRLLAVLAIPVAIMVAGLGLAGTASADTGPIQPWGTVLTGSGGGQIELTGLRSGPNLTVFELTFTPGDQALSGSNIFTPTLTYGPTGTVAAVDYSDVSTGILFSGTVPPHGHATLDFAYKVPLAALNPATLTVDVGFQDFTWTGNLADQWSAPAPRSPFGS
ncbi:hypothetical protein ACFTZB_01065 [Rhodococcus sp. NPDC057014]|uniref:hypothetical protein n=1 Tax=Rhodococcus sp. NPDC057014 TaxID=3346000 RepID=UPI00362B6021